MHQPPSTHHHVAVVGTGFGGLGAAARLLQEGFDDLVVFERADDVGGVWRDNVYPGAACDVQAHLYQLSFAPNPGWSRLFAPQPEIERYLQDVADRFGVRPHIRFGHDVEEAAWDDGRARWHIATSEGRHTADVLVAAPGALSEPRVPDLAGLDHFEGPVMHTARWDDAVQTAGKRVAVVGTGASAAQVVPALQPAVRHLTLFQRTASWVTPRGDRPVPGCVRSWLERHPRLHALLRRILFRSREVFGVVFRRPALAAQVERLARRHLRRQVPDPALRRVLTPDYRFGCKRVLLSDTYYPALTRPNVTVVDGPLVEVRPHATVGPDGVAHPTDVIVLATGFHVTDLPFARRLVGRDGRCLTDVWGDRPTAHLGTTASGFPNLFLVQGPNTGLGHTSVLLMIEAQVEYLVDALRTMHTRGLAAVEPRAEAQAAFAAEVDALAEGTVWTAGGCESWYLDASGRNAALWPGSVPAFQRRLATFAPGEYHLRPARSPLAPQPSPQPSAHA